MLQIIARIVFDHLVHGRDHGTVSQHGFNTQHHVTGHAIADHPITARIGRDIAANGTTASPTQVEWEHQVVFFYLFLQGLQDHTTLNDDCAVSWVDLFNLVHTLKRYRHFSRGGHGTLNQACQTAMGHDRLAKFMAELERSTYLLGVPRSHDGFRLHRGSAEKTSLPLTHCLARQYGVGTKGLDQRSHNLCHPVSLLSCGVPPKPPAYQLT